jgi:hypothetical protein
LGLVFGRALRAEPVDQGLLDEHWRRISPMLHRRALFAGAAEFLLYDCFTPDGHVNEDVYAYSNRVGEDAALVLFHNRHAEANGWIRWSAAYAEKRSDGTRPLRQRTLAEGLGLPPGDRLVRCRELVSGHEHLLRTDRLGEQGMPVALGKYGSRVYVDWRLVHEDGRPWRELERQLAGAACPDLEDALWQLRLEPVSTAFVKLLAAGTTEQRLAAFTPWAEASARALSAPLDARAAHARFAAHLGALEALRAKLAAARSAAVELLPHGPADQDRAGERRCLAWAALAAIGEAGEAPGGSMALRWFDELRLREPLARALREAGAQDEAGWRGAARVRALLAHPRLAPVSGEAPEPAVVAAYRSDPDVRWLLGLDEPAVDPAAAIRETGWLRLPQLIARVTAAMAPAATSTVKRAAGPRVLATLAAQAIEPAAPKARQRTTATPRRKRPAKQATPR